MTARAEAASFTGRTAWARSLALPVRDFLRTESGGALVLLAGAIAALAWANVDAHSYATFWDKELSIRIGGAEPAENLRGWVNDGLMTFFFLVIGLEARRELDMGELRHRRRRWDGRPGADLPRLQRRRAHRARMGRGDVDRHGLRARNARVRLPRLPPSPHLYPHGGRLRRPRRPARDRDRVQQRRLGHVARGGGGVLRLSARVPAAADLERAAGGRARDRDVGRAARVRSRPGRGRARARPVAQRLSACTNRPRTGDDPDAPVPRAADGATRPRGAARSHLFHLGQRTAPASSSPLDELRDRARVRAREHGYPDQRGRAPQRRDLAGDAGDPGRVRGREAGRDPRRLVAGVAPAPGRTAATGRLGDARRRWSDRRDRFHRLPADRED